MSEIKELTNVIVSLRDEMNQRFDAVDQRFETMDQRFEAMDHRVTNYLDHISQHFRRINDLENGIIEELRGLSVALGIPEIWQKLNENEKRIENRLDCVEMVTAKHTEQIDILSRKIMGNP